MKASFFCTGIFQSPIGNTTTVLLGTGTSVTQAAMRELAKAGVLVGFGGGGGTPLFSGTERDLEVAWFVPQSEYRPSEYLRNWVRFWFDDALRLQAAKAFQEARLARLRRHWLSSRTLKDQQFIMDVNAFEFLLDQSTEMVLGAIDNTALLTEEARLTKQLYRMATTAVRYGDFSRNKGGQSTDAANRFLDHGNYLAYELAATATWVLGLPHGLAVLHGKTKPCSTS